VEIPVRPRLQRALMLGLPIVAMGIINTALYHQPSMLVISGLGVYLAIAGFMMILPNCPACKSERTMRHRHRMHPGPHLVDVPPELHSNTKSR
jgi:hypothetical protein